MFSMVKEEPKPVKKKVKPTTSMLMVTTEQIPGKKITEVKGLVSGWQPRSSFSYNWDDVRDLALVALERKCCEMGGNAIIGLRFDSDVAGDSAFISHVYGTAVIVEDAEDD